MRRSSCSTRRPEPQELLLLPVTSARVAVLDGAGAALPVQLLAAAFVEETGANDAGADSQPHAVESRHETATAPPPERLRADVAALAALCGRPRGAAQRNGRVVSPPGSAKKKRRQRKLKPFAGRPRNASRMSQLYP